MKSTLDYNILGVEISHIVLMIPTGNNTGNGMISVKCTTDGFYPDIFTDISNWCSLVSCRLFHCQDLNLK